MQTLHTPGFLGKAIPLLGMAPLFLIGIAPAHAQTTSLTLRNGDAVTVTGGGTTGTINSGIINNSTTSYGDAHSSGYAVQANGTASFALGAGGSLASGDNGTTLDSEGSGPISVTGGSVSGGNGSTGIFVNGSSAVSFSGGSITTGNGIASTRGVPAVGSYGLDAEGTGPVLISGGTITSGDSSGTASTISDGVYDGGSGPVTISGGTIMVGSSDTGVVASGAGLLTISGGDITGGADSGIGLDVESGGQALITGGMITSGGPVVPGFFGPASGSGDGVLVSGGMVTITGGNITGGNTSGNGLIAINNGIINLFSQGDSAFYINGSPINNMSFTQNTSGTLTGTLFDGEALNTLFTNGGTFNFNVGDAPASAAPEPSALAIWAFVGLGAAGLVLKAKKHKAAAV